ncbi:MAG: hypothetical protein U1D35_07840 [Paracoccaceae bacterium]|nr:hypothetical protein [Paracoccaceae bacterium]
MGAVTIQQMADRVAALMEQRLHVKGGGLGEKLQNGGRRLPRRVRTAATQLAGFAQMAQNPKLLLQVDEGQVARAYDICLRHLGAIGKWDRRRAMLMGMLTSVMGSLLVAALLVAGVLYWRGYL